MIGIVSITGYKGNEKMKKIVFLAIAILAITGVHASAVKWTATGLKDSVGTALSSSTLAPFTAVATFYAADGTTVLAQSDGSLNAMGALGATWNGAATGTSYYAKLVVTDSKGGTIESELAAFSTNASATYSINFTNGNNFTEATNKFASSSWAAAPEPTSGLLLLLGFAGLALKRKRA